MNVVMKVEDVAVRYITGDFKDIGIKEYTVRRLTRNYHVKEFMAVDGVSFELYKGDMLGIIGSNGAGKSTLLKAVAGIMEPTHGKISSSGEIAALLELGSGFDGDLTVKENAYLRGAMLGYTREFMDSTYEQIIDFAELRSFEHQPFKQLSSGMKSRLAFSIASLVNPDILILDEVLSVGDGAFQEKSAQKMREIIAHGATTILVSHSLEQIRELCNKVLWLDHGRQVAFGEKDQICDQYEQFLRGKNTVITESRQEKPSEKRITITPAYELEEKPSLPKKVLNPIAGGGREVWIDLLKIIAAWMIVLIHTVGQNYAMGPAENPNWSKFLFLNVLPRCAVPMFIMISGALLLGKEIPINKALRNARHAVLLLLFWNAVYIFIRPALGWEHGNIFRELISLPVERGPSGHLWYSYLLVWIYLFSPIISVLYRLLTNHQRWYFIFITIIVPGILQFYQQCFQLGGNTILSSYWTYMTLEYMGMMFIGRWIYENASKRQKILGLSIAAALVGLIVTLVVSYIHTLKNGFPTDAFLSESSLFSIIYACGVFGIGSCLRELMEEIPSLAKQMISGLARVALGVYFSHCLFMFVVSNIQIGKWNISQNGSPVDAVVYSVICYSVVALFMMVASRIPGIRIFVK